MLDLEAFLTGYLTAAFTFGLSGVYLFYVLGPFIFGCKRYHSEPPVGTEH